ncbi:MAG: metallophosphoesterase [Longimicrobiales bacterium]|nr:metallophosphoesterase [Longimicrobiales bacterium]
MPVRILLLADTHLGFDLPLRPRVRRRRRGPDFLASYHRALEPALAGAVDLVVHAGDVFHRARVPPTLVVQAFEPLRRLADGGTQVFVVPGNHERSRIPHARFALHPGIHVFDRPRTFRVAVAGLRVALLGFPFERRDVRVRFPALVEATGWRAWRDDLALLCVHHCFEGARVGPQNYTFRNTPDVIRGRDVPGGVAAVLTGHVHRHQLLTRDLAGRALPAPILYPGSTDRTAFAEMGEAKGTVLLEVDEDRDRAGGCLVRWRFHELPTRPMAVADVEADGMSEAALSGQVAAALERAPAEAVLRLRVHGRVRDDARGALSAARLRALAPEGMNVDVVFVDEPRRPRRAVVTGI